MLRARAPADRPGLRKGPRPEETLLLTVAEERQLRQNVSARAAPSAPRPGLPRTPPPRRQWYGRAPALPPLQRFRKWSRRRGEGEAGRPCHRKCERPAGPPLRAEERLGARS